MGFQFRGDERKSFAQQGQHCVKIQMRRFLIEMNKEMSQEKKDGKRNQTFDEATQRVLKAHSIPVNINGNSRVWWGRPGKGLDDYSKKAITALETTLKYSTNPHQRKITVHSLIGFFVRINYELRKDDNISAFYLDKVDPPRLIFRSGTMVDLKRPNSVYRNLLKKANVRHVVNLYDGPYPLGDVYEAEKKIIFDAGGTYHDERDVKPSRKWRYLVQKEEEYDVKKETAFAIVAGVIKNILLPNDKQPNPGENVLVHCGGGMHRTGMVVGIIRKVFSNDSMEDIINDYRQHVAYCDEDFQGGREPLNEKFIKDFPPDKVLHLREIEQIVQPDGLFSERGYAIPK